MRRLACLILPLLLCGCAAVATQMPDGTRFAAITVLKDPAVKGAHYATTRGVTFDVGDYSSTSKTGDLASIGLVLLKFVALIP